MATVPRIRVLRIRAPVIRAAKVTGARADDQHLRPPSLLRGSRRPETSAARRRFQRKRDGCSTSGRPGTSEIIDATASDPSSTPLRLGPRGPCPSARATGFPPRRTQRHRRWRFALRKPTGTTLPPMRRAGNPWVVRDRDGMWDYDRSPGPVVTGLRRSPPARSPEDDARVAPVYQRKRHQNDTSASLSGPGADISLDHRQTLEGRPSKVVPRRSCLEDHGGRLSPLCRTR